MNQVLKIVWMGLALSAGPLLAQTTTSSKPSIEIISAPAPLQILHDHDTAQITAMRHVHYPTGWHIHSPGITVAESEMKTDYQMEFRHREGSSVYTVWATTVTVVFEYTRMDVYVSSQYGEGSCEYSQILAHEMQHVAINEKALDQYKTMITNALRSSTRIPSRAHPLIVRSQEEGRSIVSQRVLAIVNPYFQRFHQSTEMANAKIDTISNYRRIQAKCHGW
jgi:hypothetical protein